MNPPPCRTNTGNYPTVAALAGLIARALWRPVFISGGNTMAIKKGEAAGRGPAADNGTGRLNNRLSVPESTSTLTKDQSAAGERFLAWLAEYAQRNNIQHPIPPKKGYGPRLAQEEGNRNE